MIINKEGSNRTEAVTLDALYCSIEQQGDKQSCSTSKILQESFLSSEIVNLEFVILLDFRSVT